MLTTVSSKCFLILNIDLHLAFHCHFVSRKQMKIMNSVKLNTQTYNRFPFSLMTLCKSFAQMNEYKLLLLHFCISRLLGTEVRLLNKVKSHQTFLYLKTFKTLFRYLERDCSYHQLENYCNNLGHLKIRSKTYEERHRRYKNIRCES